MGCRIEVAPDALELMTEYEWPGNVRELENAIERGLILGDRKCLKRKDITIGRPPPSVSGALPAGMPLEELERRYVLQSLEENGWNKKRVAAILGVTERTLRNKLNRWTEQGLVS